MPYLILDYPRQFENDNIFAIRTLFWWGSFFSITLHLSGSAKERWLDKIVKAYPVLSAHDFHIGINEDPWQHHFDEGNYHAISDIQEEVYAQYCRRFEHLKIAARFDLRSVHEVSPLLLKNWKLLMEICYADQAPSL